MPGSNQGGIAVVAIQGSSEKVTYCSTKASFFTNAAKEKVGSLVATDYKDPPLINMNYAVRRLTPTECARLQGFPDWWCSDLETPEPTEEEIRFWMDVFETHRKVMGTAKKSRTRNQVIKWLKNPHTDSAEYKMWGNGVALPCVFFVMAGIAYYADK
jgi:DNA (cytosine-5)-methyltransferase 1